MTAPRELAPVTLSPTETEAVLQLYAARVPVEQIAAELQLGLVDVLVAVERYFGTQSPDEDKKRIAATYQYMAGSIIKKAKERGGMSNHDILALAKVLEGERKMKGLDAATKTESKLTIDGSEAEIIDTARRLGLPIPENADKTK